MKLRFPRPGHALLILLPMLFAVAQLSRGASAQTESSTAAATNAAPAEAEIPQSVFVVPKNQQEGKDPFFPRSMRPYVTSTVVVPVPTNRPPEIGDLKINGFSGSEDRPLVIINQENFGVGDVRNVVTGGRSMPLRCLEIDLAAGTAKVEIAGQTRVLYIDPSK